LLVNIISLSTGVKLINSDLTRSDKLQFIDDFILIILCNPSIVRCSLLDIISKTLLNNKKSALF